MTSSTVYRWLPATEITQEWVHNLLKYSRLLHGRHPDTREVLGEVGQYLSLDRFPDIDFDTCELDQYLKLDRSKGVPIISLAPVVQELQDFIEGTPGLFIYFHQMFDQVVRPKNAELRKMEDYHDLMAAFNTILRSPPIYKDGPVRLVATMPFYAAIALFCDTPAGFNAFIHPEINTKIYNIYFKWQTLLELSESRAVLSKEKGGWLSPEALKVTVAHMGGDPEKEKFEDFYQCDINEPYYGFKSYDDFFARELIPEKRAVETPESPEIINAACTATIHLLYPHLRETDSFWVKETPYSLRHMLGNHYLTGSFIGGTLLQGMLAPLDYHRWCSPVSGVIKATFLIPGTYYAARLDDLEDHYPNPLQDTQSVEYIRQGPLGRSQDFITAIAARGLVFIEADAPVGLICFVAVGMGDVSTCRFAVKEGQKIKKGDPLGSFHLGGSTYCLILGPHLKVGLCTDTKTGEPLRSRTKDTPGSKVQVGRQLLIVEKN
ncbi:Phophatidylserine decarboxylase-domain-containing protein [Scleroderma yunnanense]